MPEAPRTPVAVRISRPFATEEEWLSHELETVTRTSVTLFGAPLKPQGVVLRFELTLVGGQPLLRGEGRVVGFKAASSSTEAALTLRFTRLDARSKALVDRVGAVREANARTNQAETAENETVAPPDSAPATREEPSPAAATFDDQTLTNVPPPGDSSSAIAIASSSASSLEQDNEPDDDATLTPHSSDDAHDAPAPPQARGGSASAPGPSGDNPKLRAPVAPTQDREVLLQRLRQRATRLPAEVVSAILGKPSAGQ